MPPPRQKRTNPESAQPLDGEAYANRVNQHDVDLVALKKRIEELETISDGDRIIEVFKKDSRVQEKLSDWLWDLLKKKAYKLLWLLFVAVFLLSLANLVGEKFWVKILASLGL